MLDLNELLNREPSKINLEEVGSLLKGKSILITGASGSIGSVLTKEVARFGPSCITLFDHNENNQFFLEKELKENYPNIKILARIGSIADKERASVIFNEANPSVVFHCAALKHVPLCEANVSEAIHNNIFGTHVIAELAAEMKAEVFCQISTDKAVEPKSCMGATKRVAECFIQLMSQKFKDTKFVIVRFGNVLGSAGSVIPIFQKQIEDGKPLTVTHPDMTRFFMTISEAVQLLLQSSIIAKSGEIFILDMGEPIKITDLAKKLISIMSPDKDIPIIFSGVRPGEKIHEELSFKTEELIKTSHSKILKTKTGLPNEQMFNQILELERMSANTDHKVLKKTLNDLIPEATLAI